MKIRKATKKDIKQMLKIDELNNPQYPQNAAKREINEMFSKALHKPLYLVIEDDKEIVAFGGFIRSWIDEMVFNIFWVNAHPKYKGKDFGKIIVKELIRQIRNIKDKPKAKMIIISTRIPKFYEKFGFKPLSQKYDKDFILMGLQI